MTTNAIATPPQTPAVWNTTLANSRITVGEENSTAIELYS